jgi:hypothetical protein
MSFPTMNAISHGHVVSGVAAVSDSNNWFTVPAPVDVSGMEFAFGFATTHTAASASNQTVAVHDGNTTGIGTAALFTALDNVSGGTAWTDLTVRRATGTSTTDLDANDVLNLVVTDDGAATGFSAMVSFVYGLPGGVN